MMHFRTINQAIINLLGASAGGRFRVVGYEAQGKDAREVKHNKREVQSYFTQGDFPKSRGSRRSGQHDMTFTIGLTVSASARCNLAIINQQTPPPTKDQISGALAALTDAAYEADKLIDELYEIVYQILRDARNYDLGLSRGIVTDSWVDAIRKDQPVPQGELVTLTGTVQFTCSTSEAVTGDTGVLATDGISVGLDLVEGDDTIKAGVLVRRVIIGADGQIRDLDTGAVIYDLETGAPIILGQE